MSFLERLKEATIGFSGYVRLARDERGGFGYMAILLAILLTVNGYMNLVAMQPVTADLAREVAQWPDFRVTNGQFQFDGPMPFQRTMPDGSLLVIDTTGQTTPQSLVGTAALLVVRDRAYMIQPGLTPREYAFSLLTNEVTRESIRSFLAARPERLIGFVYPFLYLFQLAFKTVDAAILGLVAVLYGRSVSRPVPFALGFRLGLYAISIPTIIQWVWAGFRTWSTAGFTVWWATALVYLIAGLRAFWASQTPSTTDPR